MFGDQPFWASRVSELGLGSTVPIAELTAERLGSAQKMATTSCVVDRARSVSGTIVTKGATIAAHALGETTTRPTD